MKTDDLIASLSADLPPVRTGGVARRVALGLGFGFMLVCASLRWGSGWALWARWL